MVKGICAASEYHEIKNYMFKCFVLFDQNPNNYTVKEIVT